MTQHLFSLNRRFFLRLYLASTSIALLPKFSLSGQIGYISKDIVVRFQKWSHVATGYLDISLDETRDYLDFCLKNGVKLKDISQLKKDIYTGTPLEKKLLEGWMTGLVHLHGHEINRHYETVLMWRSAGLDNKPLTCQNDRLNWSRAPFL